jgi:hypothetical protein
MSGEKSITLEICDYLDSCPLDGFIQRLQNTEISVDDSAQIETTIAKVRLQESKLRALRQHIEYQVRKHRLQEFREKL